MAMANSDSRIEDMKKELNCSLCFEQFRDPKVLQCLHTFCKTCLEKLTQLSGSICCPICRNPSQIPPKGFAELPSNFFYKRVIDILGIERESSVDTRLEFPPCGNCDEGTEPCSYCFGCECFMCNGCLAAHSKVKSVRDSHRVTALSEIDRSEVRSLISQSGLCREHLGNKLRFFCLKCKSGVCQDCVKTSHKTHQTKNLDEVFQDLKAEVENEISQAETTLSGLFAKSSMLEELSVRLTKDSERVAGTIHKHANLLLQAVRSHEETMIAQLENYKTDQGNAVADKRSALDVLIEELQRCLTFSREVISRGNPNEIFELKTAIIQQLRELSRDDTIHDVTSLNCVKFSYSCSKDAINSLYDAGKLLISVTNPEKCVAEGEGLKQALTASEARPPATFTVTTRDKDGGVCYSEIDVVQVHIQSASLERDVHNATILDNQNGVYNVSYVPEFPGNHKVHVKVKDVGICGSPFDVRVSFDPHCTFGTFGAGSGKFRGPSCIGVNSLGELAVVDSGNKRLQLFNKYGQLLRIFPQFHENGAAVSFESPAGVAFDSRDNLVVVEQGTDQVLVLDPQNANKLLKFGGTGKGKGMFDQPCGVFLDTDGRFVVCDSGNDRVQVFSNDGSFVFEFGQDLLANPDHCLYHKEKFIVSDTGNHCLRVFDHDGNFLYNIGCEGSREGQFVNPSGIAVYKEETIIVCDYRNDRLQVFGIDGRFVVSFGTMGKSFGQFSWPEDVVVSRDNVVFVTDNENNRVYVIK